MKQRTFVDMMWGTVIHCRSRGARRTYRSNEVSEHIVVQCQITS
uniref:Uncharacterized protein n=1 Tax=Anguilla anguilla TaxID=7936 RepID=A0A0E9XJN0_ANGAN